jgi:hypothetical protein
MSATWYKLKSGAWGVKIRHDGKPGEAVIVTNKKGDEKTVWLVARAAKFDDAQLWEVTADEPAPTHKTSKPEGWSVRFTNLGDYTLDEEPF